MKLYGNYLKIHFKILLQYKISMVLSLIAQIFVFFTSYFIVLALFDKFGNIKGFTLYEILLAFSVIQFGYAMSETFACGIDRFDELIINGEFDRILLRPRTILLQILGYKINYIKLFRVIQSLIILYISIINLNVNWTLFKGITLIFMILASFLIFFGIFLLMASYCFYTIQGLEVRNLFTDGGKHMAQYPIGIFKKGFVWFFTFIIPYGFVNYYPLLYIIEKETNKLLVFSPLLVIVFLIPCFLSFKWGIKNYTSTGS